MNTEFDVERARRDTRGCEEVIHFNNAGSALMPIPVAESLHGFLYKEELLGGYETVEQEKKALDHFYGATSKLLNCEPKEVAFVENATRAWDMAFYSFRFSRGDKILTTISEYGSNVIAYNQQANRYGVEVIFVPNDVYGQIDVTALKNLIDEKVKLISISMIPTGGGLVNPAAEVGKIANTAGIPYLLDACQAVGQIPLDVKEIGCDILSGTGRKFLRGPRGTGLLYVREALIERLEPPFLDQHAADLVSATEYIILPDAKRFENWEQFFAGKAALGVAIDYALSFGIERIQSRIYGLAGLLRLKLAEIDGVNLTDEGMEKCGIVTFHTEQRSSEEIKSMMKRNEINVSVSDGSGSLVSYRQRNIVDAVRASVHYYNTEQEIIYFLECLQSILREPT